MHLHGAKRGLLRDPRSPIVQIFADGTDGFYFDGSKTDRTFQDTTGTPADDAAESIGLALESSKWAGASYDTILAAASNLTLPGSWTMSTAGTATATESPAGTLNLTGDGTSRSARGDYQLTTVAGRQYRVDYTSATNAPGIDVGTTQGGTTIISALSQAVGTRSFVFTATGTTTWLRFYRTGASLTTVSGITCRWVPGNHGVQTTSGARPTRQAGGVYRFDGLDDNLLTTLTAGASMTAIVKLKPDAGASGLDVALGMQANSSTRFRLGITGAGYVGAGVGSQDETTIVGASVDYRGSVVVVALTCDGNTVNLYTNGALVYTGAQAGSPSTTTAFTLGALNSAGTATAFAQQDIYYALAIKKALTGPQIQAITNLWGTT